jgi:hypothetical protein
MDVAVESMYRARRQKWEKKCQQLENIVELLSDSDQIEVKMKFIVIHVEKRVVKLSEKYRNKHCSYH